MAGDHPGGLRQVGGHAVGTTFRHPDNWTFHDKGVADGFDAHVREQLPWYDLATEAVAFLVRHYLPKRGLMIDIGASNGNIGRACANTLKAREAHLVSYEESAEMADLFNAPGELVIQDAAMIGDFGRFDVAVMMLVLMFLDVEARTQLLDKLKASVRPGGALIIVDRVETEGGYLDQALYRLTLQNKLRSGATAQQIIDKELSLAGVQRPMAPRELEGFRCWFRFGHFCGWVYEAH